MAEARRFCRKALTALQRGPYGIATRPPPHDDNGPAAHPLFRYLKQALPRVLGGRIKWNFTKFLIGRDGTPLTRFAPFTTPEKMEASIVAALTR